MPARFEVYAGSGHHDRWYWRLVGANGEKVAQSEAYTRKEDAIRGALDARQAALDADPGDIRAQ